MKIKKYILLFIIPILVIFISRSFSITYNQEINSVEIQSTNYPSPGTFHINKSAKWTGNGEAEVNFNVTTKLKGFETQTHKCKDVIFVIDISGSMTGRKITHVKEDTLALIDDLFDACDAKVALIEFETTSQILTGFTNDKDLLTSLINGLTPTGTTNYNAALLNVGEVLQGYESSPTRDLITLFFTDGYPNVDTPNEVATYGILKAQYPKLTINGIQYEMGDEIIPQLDAITDYAYAADQITLKDILPAAIETTSETFDYNEFVVTDYVHNDYFTIGSVNDITVSMGTVSLEEENGVPKITWTINNMVTGFNANMKIKLKVKPEIRSTTAFYPTNKGETIDYEISDGTEEHVNSELTPVLKDDFNVIYNPNAPDGCTLPSISPERHYLFETVSKKDDNLVCEGWSFRGFEIIDEDRLDMQITDTNTFIMPSHDVHINGAWTKVNIQKSTDGKVKKFSNGTLMQHNSTSSKTFGRNINRDSFESIITQDEMNIPDNAIDVWDVSEEQNNSIKAWYVDADNNGKYELYLSADGYINANPYSRYTFYGFRNVKMIDVSFLDTSNVVNMENMFMTSGYNVQSFEIIGLSSFDTSSVTNMSNIFENVGYNANTWSIGNLSGWDTSNVIYMSGMFDSAGNSAGVFDIGDLDNWNTSQVTYMDNMFSFAGANASTFNIGDLSNWDTSKVRFMTSLFQRAGQRATNWSVGNLSNWDTSQVVNMSKMFSGTGIGLTSYDISYISGWDVSKVQNMNSMFSYAGFNATTWFLGDLSNWDTKNVLDMSYMFYHAGGKDSTFDINSIGINNWNTSQVTNMMSIFEEAAYNSNSFNLNLESWDTSSVTTFEKMFYKAGFNSRSFNIVLPNNSSTDNLTTTREMFYNAGYNSQSFVITGLDNMNMSHVTIMSSMFYEAGYNADSFLIDVGGWDTSSVKYLYSMFYYAGYSATNWSIGDLSSWNLSGMYDDVTDYEASLSTMFSYAGYNAQTFNLGDLSNWDVSKITDMLEMFSNAGYNATTWYIGSLNNWDVSNVTNMSYMFYHAGSNAQNFILDLSTWDTSNVTDMSYMFGYSGYESVTWSVGDLSNWDTSNVTDMTCMFAASGYNATTWNIGDLSNWHISSVVYMSSMFEEAGYNAQSINLTIDNWDISEVLAVDYMFNGFGYNAGDLTLSLKNWKSTTITSFDDYSCGAYDFFYNIGNTATNFNVDISGWDLPNVEAMKFLFKEEYEQTNVGYNTNTFKLNMSNWNIPKVTDLSSFFWQAGYNAQSFELDVSNWNVSSVTNMNEMFAVAGYNATTWSLGDLSNWDTRNVLDMSYMFHSAGANATTSYNIGTLNIYALKIENLFEESNSVSATINIYNSPTTFMSAFKDAATINGSSIVVNYSSNVTNIDNIIFTAYSYSNVIKGVQLD